MLVMKENGKRFGGEISDKSQQKLENIRSLFVRRYGHKPDTNGTLLDFALFLVNEDLFRRKIDDRISYEQYKELQAKYVKIEEDYMEGRITELNRLTSAKVDFETCRWRSFTQALNDASRARNFIACTNEEISGICGIMDRLKAETARQKEIAEIHLQQIRELNASMEETEREHRLTSVKLMKTERFIYALLIENRNVIQTRFAEKDDTGDRVCFDDKLSDSIRTLLYHTDISDLYTTLEEIERLVESSWIYDANILSAIRTLYGMPDEPEDDRVSAFCVSAEEFLEQTKPMEEGLNEALTSWEEEELRDIDEFCPGFPEPETAE